MSVSEGARLWLVRHSLKEPITSIEELSQFLCQQRGVEENSATHFFHPEYARDIHDPLLFPAMSEACDRIFFAIKNKERIMVHGDYDTDGISGTALLITVLRDLGASIIPFIPHRHEEGYGLNQAVIMELASEFDLLITVDCGISNAMEIAQLKKKNKDVIIVDHHELAEGVPLPSARAILHPRYPTTTYPFSWLSGAGVAWKLCQALLRDERSHTKDENKEKWLLDLAMLGTVADMVPMMGENRLITRFGLEIFRRTKRVGLQALLQASRVGVDDITAESLSWRVIPLLNAPGKMDHAQPALDLLLATTVRQAQQYIAQLLLLNTSRKQVTERVLREAEEQLGEVTTPVIFTANTRWPAGVAGLVAGKLANKYNRPAIVVGGNGRHGIGSARAPQGMDVLAILRTNKDLLLKMGGHIRAAGFSVEDGKISEFQEAVLAKSATIVPEAMSQQADAILHHQLINWNTFELQEKFAPFGEGNRKPSFVARGLEIASWRPVGKQQQHAKYTFVSGDRLLDGIGFGMVAKMQPQAKVVDVLFDLSINEYRGNRSLQLEVRDIGLPDSITIQNYAEGHVT